MPVHLLAVKDFNFLNSEESFIISSFLKKSL